MSREMEGFRQKDFWKREAVDGLWRIALALVPLMALVLVPSQVIHGLVNSPAAPPASVPPAFFRSPIVPVGDKRIVGVIRDEAGKPVKGLSIGLVWETRTESALAGQALTDAQGRFTFSRLPNGNFDCQVSPEEGQDKSGQYVALTVPQDVHVTLGDGALEKDLALVVSTGALVTGRVVDDQTGKPVAGVFVNAGSVPSGSDPSQWPSWPAEMWDATTDAFGSYQVRVMPGPIFVRVVETSGGPLLTERVRPVARTGYALRGQTATVPDIPVSFNPMIAFTGPDGQPVANTPIRITPESLERGGYILGDHTDNRGIVVLSTFQSGTFSLSQNDLYASGAFQWSPGRPLIIQMGGETLTFPDGGGKVQLTAGSSAVVTGYVVSEDEKPIPNALVKVFETDPKSHYGLGDKLFRTDASGNFHAPLDPSGEYQVSVRADGFNQVMVSKKPLSLAKGQPTHLGTIHLMHADGFVSGRIVDRSGKPMPGILAAVQGGETGISAALTDAQGRFRIPNVVPSEALHLTLCLHGELMDGDSGNAGFQSNEQMDSDGVRAGPVERQIIWHPHSGGY